MNTRGSRKMPADAPTAFVKPRWKPLVIVKGNIDPRFYEICALSELKNSLRSGDIWVSGSRQFRNFDEYLLPIVKFAQIERSNELPIAINPNCEEYLNAIRPMFSTGCYTTNQIYGLRSITRIRQVLQTMCLP
jgi:hypothetical protein